MSQDPNQAMDPNEGNEPDNLPTQEECRAAQADLGELRIRLHSDLTQDDKALFDSIDAFLAKCWENLPNEETVRQLRESMGARESESIDNEDASDE